ncbi:MAG: hypothetical protein C4532_14250 [Candidatus Abyssobacteria bacterium SURF_17]|uniref:Protein kinase domain-containing protein n=1 Tax=Candidatus Abyssobacteria bacterium SURF_17 TaxID=2093361 RepID=A0A419EU63_9BACT|nr:MAG: hypothetical protein C4532_14250 [Candidatus Abyssubacteria bacterium SURF_17]
MNRQNQKWLSERIAQVAAAHIDESPEILTDTTEFMSIHRGHVLQLDGHYYLITGNVYESRFGMSDEPKYWVKKAVDLETGAAQIIKLVYKEEFTVRVGPLKIRCYRHPRKESQVLELVRGYPHFMQGRALFDICGNEVRAIDYIRGESIFNLILEMSLSHEEYFYTVLPRILRNLKECFLAIQFLHDHKLCHGDIRNDHIIVEHGTGTYRWIDFDLTQDFSDFDIWSIGNVMQFCVGMGMRTFREVLQSPDFPDAVKHRLCTDDASAFYEHRIMNLQKLFPYIPDRLNDILLHFAVNTTRFYESAAQIVADVGEALDELGTR